jgi:peptidoglycan/xylan/chitin deacetylase (PgdA/CDA1 family)
LSHPALWILALAIVGIGVAGALYIVVRSRSGVSSDAYKHVNRPGVIYWHGSPDKRDIALTFDDGPRAPHTAQLLEVLKRHRARATFFLLGTNVDADPASARAVAEAGHAIGSHAYTHRSMVLQTRAEVERQLARADAAIRKATGVRPAFFRPPYGAENDATLAASKALGYVAVEWSVSSKDWDRPGVDVIVENVLSQIHNGAIVLMHDGGGDRSQTVAAVARLIPELRRRGYRLVTVPELLDTQAQLA